MFKSNINIPQRLEKCIQELKKSSVNYKSNCKSYEKSKENLIKQNHALYYELAVFHRIFQELTKEEEGSNSGRAILMETVKEKCQYETQIRVRKDHEEQMKEKLKVREEEICLIKEEKEKLEVLNLKLKKELEIYKKKSEKFDKIGGKATFDKQETQLKQTLQKMQIIEAQNKLLSKKNRELHCRDKILLDLNNQNEEQLAELMVQNSKENQMNVSNIKSPQPNKNDSKNSSKIELLSALQKNKELQSKMTAMQTEKEQIRSKMKQRQSFYSKMLNFQK